MEDNKKIENGEDENLSSEIGKDQKTFTSEEVEAIKKQMQSDSEKGVQKIIGEKKAYQTAMQNLTNISEDPTKLVDLYEENPNAAKIILDTYYDGQDIESFKYNIGYEVNYTDPKEIEKLVEKKAQELKNKEKQEQENQQIENNKNAFIEKLKMSEEEKKKFEEAFEERKELKSFKVSDIQKHLEKAYKEIADEEQLKELKKQEVIANSMAIGSGKGGKESKNEKQNNLQKNSEYNKNFLKERGIL